MDWVLGFRDPQVERLAPFLQGIQAKGRLLEVRVLLPGLLDVGGAFEFWGQDDTLSAKALRLQHPPHPDSQVFLIQRDHQIWDPMHY